MFKLKNGITTRVHDSLKTVPPFSYSPLGYESLVVSRAALGEIKSVQNLCMSFYEQCVLFSKMVQLIDDCF